MRPPVDLVLIGRNEGARLVAALDSAKGQARRIVYVDSGSTDDSVRQAQVAGAQVVLLDMSVPFTAARARNAGFEALEASGEAPEFVMFVDGDCALVDGFVDRAAAYLENRPDLAVVTGWRSEIHRDASLFNQLCDFEWRRPAGPMKACGGDMLVRAEAFRAIGGFDPEVIAAEDDEFCTRLRKQGWGLERIPAEMTRHDAHMLEFGQWWQRAVRTGHGFAQVGYLHPDYFVKERRRVLIFGLLLPLFVLLVLFLGMSVWWLVLILLAYLASYLRTAQGLIGSGLPMPEATRHAGLISLSKFPNLIGMAIFHWRMLRNGPMRIIEYK